ncbi:hypothetical protein A2778_01090 [Candidatus Daviesbacteria bacterium RIFCSPHIGHO2_01_FULL_40_24]|nr:MAG: hypothetical protein A2778_01090 [Candidatus Daviesbacteria bacterium RIFCSPHIGHO2_01_FULL_40_24]OGE29802.1 MAG: hypothetical protein A3C29_00720 [Candidatus Daviesbacteria bacterium RIFCSPHIGHO2_02_FULL_40_16]OGE42751.1 MAG: hypothetical protein A3A53_05540 [Candidatus Daviesbacteria bacterium RIFCSPLOWO2_01_FULL_39_23]OGE67279.1 MAG: hypothetical protein A3J16_06260 [Candidatus Daviesbacteria bacterium RIFCSPLOWO2_02_FULL_39_13]
MGKPKSFLIYLFFRSAKGGTINNKNRALLKKYKCIFLAKNTRARPKAPPEAGRPSGIEAREAKRAGYRSDLKRVRIFL